MQAQMLAPAAVLVFWSIIMLFWMAGTRFPAMAKSEADLKNAAPGGRGQDLEGVLPREVQWKAHNYAHLMEQPTIFYPTVIILAMMGANGLDVALAWTYVAIRILHSVWQATVNRIPVRFLMFVLSTLALAVLALRALSVTLFAGTDLIQ
jgi:hypothetical protein